MSDLRAIPFNAYSEAARLDFMAKDALDTQGKESLKAAQQLADEWASLSNLQRTITKSALNDWYGSTDFDAMPIARSSFDAEGNFTGITFEAGLLDFHKGPHAVKIEMGNGSVTASRLEHDRRSYALEYSKKLK